MFCWSKRRGTSHYSLWKIYIKRMQEEATEKSAAEVHHGLRFLRHSPHSHTVSAAAFSSPLMSESSPPPSLNLKDMVEWFSASCLSPAQVAMLKKIAKNYETSGECGECIFLPRQVRCPSPSSTSVDISPVYLLAQVLRWPDLQTSSAKDLLRLRHLCSSPPPPSSITLSSHLRPEVATSQSKKLSHYSLSCNVLKAAEANSPPPTSEVECCNPFHWSREVHLEPLSGPRILPQNSSSNQRTSSADSSSKALLNMLYNPPEYQAAETESVKDFSESSSSEVISPSTATGISRIACGQVSADSIHHDLDRFCDSPGGQQKKQYYAPSPSKSRSHHWCLVRYWEESAPLGRAHFSVVHPVLNVFHDTPAALSSQTSQGMSVKNLENPKREKKTADLRARIGLGFQLILDEEERVVIIHNRSSLSLFVSSVYLNESSKEKAHPRVVKVPPGYSIKASHIDFVPKPNLNEPGVCRWDNIHVSFGKGWGEKYSRSSHLNCPCWVEVVLDNVQADVKRTR